MAIYEKYIAINFSSNIKKKGREWYILNINNKDLLSNAIAQGIIDLSYVQEQMEMNLKKQILEDHSSSIWYSKKEKVWYCYIPDKIKGRVKRKRKNKNDIEQVLYDAYKEKYNSCNNKSNITFEDLFYEFISYKKTQVGMATIKRIMTDWKKYYISHTDFTKKQINSITKIDIDLLLNNIADQFKPKDKAFRNLCGILKQSFEYAVDSEYIDKSPYRVKVNKKNIQHVRKKPNIQEIYTVEEKLLLIAEMERMLINNPSNTIPLGIMLDFEIGVRVGELLAITSKDICDNKLHIHRQRIKVFNDNKFDKSTIKESGWITVEYTKSEHGDRWIPLSNLAKEYINRILEINNSFDLIYEDYLFVSKNGNVYTEDALSSQLKRACQRINIPVRRPHKIRKTYASILYQNGVPITIISKLLGHADESTTLKHYIYNINNDQESDEMVLKALQNNRDFNVTKCDRKIISFSDRKKMGNPSNYKASQA